MSSIEKLIEMAMAEGADSAEVYYSNQTKQKIDVLNGKVDESKYAKELGMGLRVLKNKAFGFAATTDLSVEALKTTASQAVENALCATPSEFNILPKLNQPKVNETQLQILDQDLLEQKMEEKISKALWVEKAAYAADLRIKKTEMVSYSDAAYVITLANSFGQKLSYSGTYAGASADVIAEDSEGQQQSGSAYQYVVNLNDFDPQMIGRESARQATLMLGATSWNTAKTNLIFDPMVSAQFLSAISPLVLASYVQKGKSLLAGKKGQTIASNKINLIDSGVLPKGLGSTPFDGEGLATQETELIKNGILQGYLYDFFTAQKENVLSTGNASRGSYDSVPDVSTNNFYLKPGKVSADDLVTSVSKGILITRVMGMHTIDPISGDFSVGAAGVLIENGKLGRAVRGIAIAGHLSDLLNNIIEVGSDLKFYSSIGAPSLLIEGISVSGK
jgi:PmbA protein